MSQTKSNITGTFSIYCIEHLPSGKKYIGLTSVYPAVGRWKQHQYAARRRGKRGSGLLQRAIRKHGIERFSFYVIYEAVDLLEARAVERGLIASIGTTNKSIGYNLTSGGEFLRGFHHSLATKRKMSISNKRTQGSDEMRMAASVKMKAAWANKDNREKWLTALKERSARLDALRGGPPLGRKGRKKPAKQGPPMRKVVSIKQRLTLSKKIRGRPVDPEYAARRRTNNGGKWFSKEAIEKMRAATQRRKGRNVSSDYAARRRAVNGGSWHSVETRAKISKGWSAAAKAKHKETWQRKMDVRRYGSATAAVRAMVRELPAEFVPRAA